MKRESNGHDDVAGDDAGAMRGFIWVVAAVNILAVVAALALAAPA